MPLLVPITIAGLGAGAPGDITLATWEALKASPRTFLRTGKHPVVDWLRQEGVSFATFDHYYDEADGFEEVYERIAGAILTEARRGPLLYAVPGHPLVAEESVRLVLERAEQEGLEVDLLPAVSFLDAMFSLLRLDPGRGLQVVDGLRLEAGLPRPDGPAIVTQVYSRLVASDVKLSLLDSYPPEHPVTVVRGAGVPGIEKAVTVPLFELDRLSWVDHLTSLYLPESDGRQAVGGDTDNRVAEAGGMEVIQVYEGKGAAPSSDTFIEGDADPQACHCECLCRFPLDPLVDILARLRGEGGCPWDREQDHRTLKPFLLEEAYEVLEALDEEDMYKICEELGDLLLQIVFHAQIAAENRHFDMNDVVAGISKKMIRRHPHVFGSVTVRDSREVLNNWEQIKAEEKGGEKLESLLAGVSMAFPALLRAAKLQEKASRVGFDWPDYRGALDKTREELDELEAAITGGDRVKMEGELGDLLFSTVNLARLLGMEPETALSGTSRKFVTRFNHVEKRVLLSGKDFSQCTLSELDKWWEEAKILEKKEKI